LRRRTMGYTLIRYSVKDTELEANRGLVAKVFEALGEAAPRTARYLVLELDDGEFVHVVGEGSAELTELAAFKAFTQNHAERRSTPVRRSPVKIIGNYRILADAG
jgi:prolyl-tRNA editing enzyme YbaK/EbsC (Cys-tRNA(Pro) deacylase)